MLFGGLRGAGTTVVMMRGSDSWIDARVVVGDDVGAEIVSRETFWCWRASWITLDPSLWIGTPAFPVC